MRRRSRVLATEATNPASRLSLERTCIMEILPHGRLHPSCLPAAPHPPCPRCGRVGLVRPEKLILEAASLPSEVDLFRLTDFETTILCTARFQEAALGLGLDGVRFQELPVR